MPDNLVELLKRIDAAGVKLEAVNGSLRVTPESKAKRFMLQISHHKDAILRRLRGEPDEMEEKPPEVPAFEPFPVHLLPETVGGYITAGAAAIGCDESYVALPLLSCLSSSIGNSRALQAKNDWIVPSILWTAIIGNVGSQKTPGYRMAVRIIRQQQRDLMKEFKFERQRYERDRTIHKQIIKTWKPTKESPEPPEEPEEPHQERLIVSDITVQALAQVLLNNGRGILLGRDELSGWLASFGQYQGDKAADTSHWLSMYNGEPMIVDRKTGIPSIYVPVANCSIAGTIQPEPLKRAINGELRENGLAARILMAWPPHRAKTWTEADIHPSVRAKMEEVLDKLRSLEMEGSDDDPEPVLVRMSPDARRRYIQWYNEHNRQAVDKSGDIAGVYSKLEETSLRLALICQLCWWAEGACGDDLVDLKSIEAGIGLAEWFKREIERVYLMLDEVVLSSEMRQLAEWIERRGGRVRPRDLQRGLWRIKTAGDAEDELNQLRDAGYGEWEEVPPGPKGGSPTREFVLFSASTLTQPRKTRDSGGSVDVDAPSNSESEPEATDLWERSVDPKDWENG